MRIVFASLAAALSLSPALAQSINVDLDFTTAGAGVPAPTFGGAMASPGVWNSITTAAAGPIALTNTNGTSTGVTLTRAWSTTANGNFGFNNSNTTGDFEKLLDDGESLAVAQSVTYTFNNVTPGTYSLCIYAIAPDNTSYQTQVNINGTGNHTVGGTMPVNAFTLGVTHYSVGSIVPAGGSLSVTATGLSGYGTVNGLQLVLTDTNTRFVRPAAPAGGDGRSWATAYRTLDAAIADANAHAGISQIWMTTGTYLPTVQTIAGDPRSAAFSIRSGLSIFGGFAGTESSPDQRDFIGSTFLSGELGAAGAADNAYHVIKSTGVVTLDGLWILGANNNHVDSTPPAVQSYGGGIYHDTGTLSLTGCTISSCACSTTSAAGFGGGVFAGGALNIKRCVFGLNTARFGAGVWAEGALKACNCQFNGNAASLAGGGISQASSSPSAILANCLFINNTAGAPTGIQGGAAYRGDAASTLINCTFSANGGDPGACVVATHGSGAATNTIALRNCILWGNATPNLYGGGALNHLTVEYSDVQGGTAGFPGFNNINADPLFFAPPGNCTLRPHSPCIDAGEFSGSAADFLDIDEDGNFSEALPLDGLGNPRRLDDTGTPNSPASGSPPLDMGAYEFQFISCVADLDDGSGTGAADGGVTIDDLLFFLTLFAAGDTRGDLDDGSGTGTRDGGVTVEDLLYFLNHYAAGC